MSRKRVLDIYDDEDALKQLLTDDGVGYRASIILQAHEGKSARGIARSLKMGRDNVRRWIKAYREQGIAGLQIKRGGGRPSVVDDVTRLEILSLSPDLSVRDIAERYGIGASTVQRVLVAERLVRPKTPVPRKEEVAAKKEAERKKQDALLRQIFPDED